MKIITIRRPWAHLIVNGSKNIWTMDTGLELVIKAAGSATRLAGLQQAVKGIPAERVVVTGMGGAVAPGVVPPQTPGQEKDDVHAPMKPEAVHKVICYHEAGHTVMAILLGQRIEYVSVDMEGKSHLYRPSAAYDAREGDVAAQVAGHEIDAKVALAGPLAQLISRPNRNDRATKAVLSREEDFAQAKNAATSIALLMAGEPLRVSARRETPANA